jgi:hypothetical protein
MSYFRISRRSFSEGGFNKELFGDAKIRLQPFLKKFYPFNYLYLGVYRVLSCTFTSGLLNLLVDSM